MHKSKIQLILSNCRKVEVPSFDIVITDPPFNVGYDYNTYDDNLTNQEYLSLLSVIKRPAVVIHYPEETINLLPSILGEVDECVSWVYSSRLKRHHRLITFWGVKPKFERVREPYAEATLKDKRNKGKYKEGGRAIKDWWNIQYLNNMSKEKTEHPCQMPLKIMKRIILISTNEGDTIYDPFFGSGTTAVACIQTGRNFIGTEIDIDYFKIAERRIKEAQMQPRLL